MFADSRLAVLGALEEGKLMKEVARKFGVSKSIISRISSKYRLRNNVERLSGSGHRRKTIVRQDRQMLKTVKLDPRKSSRCENICKKIFRGQYWSFHGQKLPKRGEFICKKTCKEASH